MAIIKEQITFETGQGTVETEQITFEVGQGTQTCEQVNLHNLITKIISEIINISEAKNYIRGKFKVISEAVNISELYNKLRGLFKIISETLNISELKNYIRDRLKIVSELISIDEYKAKIPITYQNKSEVSVGTDQTSITIPVPTGFSAGDLLIACIVMRRTSFIYYHGTPVGWTLIQKTTGAGASHSFAIWYRIAEVGDTEWTWTITTGGSFQQYGVILRYIGQALVDVIHASGVTVNEIGSTTPTAPDVAYMDLEEGSLVLQAFGADDDDTPYITPVQLLERYNGISNTGAGTVGSAGGDKVVSGSGNTGTAVFTMNANEEWTAITVVIEASGKGDIPTLKGILKVISEILNISELKNYLKGIFKIISEVINISELYNKISGFFKVFNETLNINETKNYFRNRFKVINETLNISELKNKLRTLLKIINETLNINETKNKLRSLLRVISEIINISELKNKFITIWEKIKRAIASITQLTREDASMSKPDRDTSSMSQLDRGTPSISKLTRDTTTWDKGGKRII